MRGGPCVLVALALLCVEVPVLVAMGLMRGGPSVGSAGICMEVLVLISRGSYA